MYLIYVPTASYIDYVKTDPSSVNCSQKNFFHVKTSLSFWQTTCLATLSQCQFQLLEPERNY